MKKWLRRLIYGFLTLIWLMVMVLPLFAILLAANGEVQIGQTPQRHVRFFTIQEEAAEGVGVEWTRPFQNRATTANCTYTNVYYLFWENQTENQNTSYCQCVDPFTNTPSTSLPDRCQ
jgi:hypothetical protein